MQRSRQTDQETDMQRARQRYTDKLTYREGHVVTSRKTDISIKKQTYRYR